ncbi:MAG: response regulator [Acidobacteria bacterium]|nr:response regulator [Acidobacteriota bacterium]
MTTKLLVVEDSHSMRAYLTTLLQSYDIGDFEIVEASSGFEALKVLPHHDFSAILTDINMPDINGLELVSFLKSHPQYQRIPILVISTEATEEDRKRAESLGAEAYLIKPFEPQTLADKLSKLLGI